ncbi:hypothetical protein [Chryseobacterium populi]|uniref:Uncharacterized protein n=1 Tax=Chryseobacterium populi TaxID=1144316 RepID=J3CL11_9FLAO|nr:hypothetical protein [Chryseobacterium populi]EJL73676.1 hypothetical protein PMI13_01438 [Chryseobacterium populi]
MNTFKDNLEHQIKKQIEEREIAPSRDLWSEIELHTENTQSKSRISWVLTAACIVLALSLGFVLFFNSEKETIQEPKVTETHIKIPQKDIPESSDEESKPVYANQKQEIIQENIKAPAKIINEVSSEKVLTEQTEKLSKKETASVIGHDISQIPAEKIIAQSDSSKIPAKKKKYVDPSTLLFSVEHKDVIEKTKESNVATIDLNGK